MQKLTDLKVFEDACEIVGLDAQQVNKLITDWMKMLLVIPNLTDVSVEAYVRITIVVRAANQITNEGKPWVPNWKDSNEAKYFPWFDLSGPSGFRFGVCDRWTSASGVGSRLCFKTYETAEYIGKQFEDLYRQFMVISEEETVTIELDKLTALKKEIYKEIRVLEKQGLSNITHEDLLIMTLLQRNKLVVE